MDKNINAAFDWKCQPEAEKLISDVLDQAILLCPFIAQLEKDLIKLTSTRLFDWLDHVIVGRSNLLESELYRYGFQVDNAGADYRVFYHPGAQLPRVVVKDQGPPVLGIAVSVESIADFLMAHGVNGWIEGSPYAAYRRCNVITENGISLFVIERRGTRTIEPAYPDPSHANLYLEALELWITRPRALENEDEAFTRTLFLASEIVEMLGRDMAAWLVLEGERRYWQVRNHAGQIQKNRQDRLGMGWANHDHHTFRSSRHHFQKLVRLFEILGFSCRERFYAGEEAGWGAQVMENANAKLVLFLDVDLASHEIAGDFAHQNLPELSQYNTVGLWCGLHGDSILKAGMHHLEAQFMFDELTEELGHEGIGMMQPFSDFSYLRQAFTKGEMWKVDHERVEKLVKHKIIDHAQADHFIKQGALGSHLENLQRREGYKGFNQKNVSIIIKQTDPRNS